VSASVDFSTKNGLDVFLSIFRQQKNGLDGFLVALHAVVGNTKPSIKKSEDTFSHTKDFNFRF
jgi:hypothetical protein